MEDYIKKYKIKLKTLSPLFIGDGNKLTKKDYIVNGKTLYVIDYVKMYNTIQEKKLDKQFENYMFNDRRELSNWVKENNINQNIYKNWAKYKLNLNGYINRNDIMTFIKDPYGCPYVPGSSLKGAIRTALLLYELNDKDRRINVTEYLDNAIESKKPKNYGERNRFLNEEIEKIESMVFDDYKSAFKEKKFEDISDYVIDRSKSLKSIMSGIIVSDSKPLKLDNLTLAQKVDVDIEGRKNNISVYRESLKPGISIEFDLTIDTKKTRYSLSDIVNAINFAMKMRNKYFYSKFGENLKGENETDKIICIGGGVGYQDKTITHSIYKDESVEVVSEIFTKIIVEKDSHKGINQITEHRFDSDYGSSPRVCKKTVYNDKYYNMGLCSIKFLK